MVAHGSKLQARRFQLCRRVCPRPPRLCSPRDGGPLHRPGERRRRLQGRRPRRAARHAVRRRRLRLVVRAVRCAEQEDHELVPGQHRVRRRRRRRAAAARAAARSRAPAQPAGSTSNSSKRRATASRRSPTTASARSRSSCCTRAARSARGWRARTRWSSGASCSQRRLVSEKI